MTIYGRFGGEVKIVADCGEQQPAYLKTPCHLVLVEFVSDDDDNGKEMYRFAEFLKATDGWKEIEKAIQDAPEKYDISKFTDFDREQAFKEAE